MVKMVLFLAGLGLCFAGPAAADPVIDRARSICQAYGFKRGTETFANCTMQTSREIRQGQQGVQHQRKCDEIRARMPSARRASIEQSIVGPYGTAPASRVRAALLKELAARGCP